MEFFYNEIILCLILYTEVDTKSLETTISCNCRKEFPFEQDPPVLNKHSFN